MKNLLKLLILLLFAGCASLQTQEEDPFVKEIRATDRNVVVITPDGSGYSMEYRTFWIIYPDRRDKEDENNLLDLNDIPIK